MQRLSDWQYFKQRQPKRKPKGNSSARKKIRNRIWKQVNL